jgi:hypothetical protein
MEKARSEVQNALGKQSRMDATLDLGCPVVCLPATRCVPHRWGKSICATLCATLCAAVTHSWRACRLVAPVDVAGTWVTCGTCPRAAMSSFFFGGGEGVGAHVWSHVGVHWTRPPFGVIREQPLVSPCPCRALTSRSGPSDVVGQPRRLLVASLGRLRVSTQMTNARVVAAAGAGAGAGRGGPDDGPSLGASLCTRSHAVRAWVALVPGPSAVVRMCV